jgi:hypothetical protein
MNRRTMLKSVGTGAAIGVAAPSTLLLEGCEPKNLSVYVETVVGSLKEVATLLPSLGPRITQAIKIAEDFDAAYRAGKFESALALFENLSGVISQIAGDVGLFTPTVKVALAVAAIAMRAIAVLLKSQEAEPAVAKRLKLRPLTPQERARTGLVNRLADAGTIDQLFAAAKL